MHDYVSSHPEQVRLLKWTQMEPQPADPDPDDPVRLSTARKIEKVRAAQQAGDLDPSWNPSDILIFVSQLAMSPVGRDAVVAAVDRLFPPADRSSDPAT
ncbi:hypothetical protein ACQP2E_18565 [Actinoplanes sp. CA-015351]|uniref:hypothetical protein n=1 Tax=Actinoplanes sp. CA-015351 TaxID=3239897 RepID=UPI003D97463E